MIDFSTAQVRPRERRAAWESELARICGRLATDGFDDDDCEASIQMHDVGGIRIGRYLHNASRITHNKGGLNRERCGEFMLILQVRGQSTVSQGGRETTICENEIAIFDSFRPFVSRFAGSTEQIVAYLPAAELTTRCSSSIFARPIRWSSNDGLTNLARSILLSLACRANGLGEEDAVHARQLLVSLVKHMVERKHVPQRASEVPLPEHRIRVFIDAHLADPELHPSQVANACSISLRRLHRSFAGTPWSVCSWIRHRRLEECRQALLDPKQNELSITQIAFRWGFNDAAHFSRSFRDAYDESPRDVRRRLYS